MQHINKICLSCIVVLCTLTVCSCSNRASAEYLTNAQLTTLCDAVISTAVLDSPSELLTDSCISKTRGLNSYLASLISMMLFLTACIAMANTFVFAVHNS